MIRNLIFILTAFFIVESRALADNLCTGLLSSKPTLELKGAEGLIAYLGALLENRVIGDEALSQLIDHLIKGKVINPISEEESLLSSAAQIHREGLQKFIDDRSLDQMLLLKWTQATQAERKRVQVTREETSGVTQEIYRKMEFRPIPAGSFMMGEGESKVLVKLTRPFEMMSTPITQRMWAEVMGKNPSVFRDGDHGATIMVNGKPIQMQPDHPVEEVSWYDVQEFIQKLNERDPNYEYRLPTEAEWEYAARAGIDTPYSFGKNLKLKELSSCGWFKENSKGHPHPVGELKPNGFELYDMHGNVWEWVSDRYDNALKESSSALVDPVGPDTGFEHVLRGGSWCGSAQHFFCNVRAFQLPSARRDLFGARLVRTPQYAQ